MEPHSCRQTRRDPGTASDSAAMTTHFKITRKLLDGIRRDLDRRHAFAAERVGFISCKVGALASGGVVILAHAYQPVEDDDYLNDPAVGAMMGPDAIRKAMQHAYNENVSMFHVHTHDHLGTPWFSKIDLREAKKFVPDFWNVRPEMPHGALVLSMDSLAGLCWLPATRQTEEISKFLIIGAPLLNIGTN